MEFPRTDHVVSVCRYVICTLYLCTTCRPIDAVLSYHVCHIIIEKWRGWWVGLRVGDDDDDFI